MNVNTKKRTVTEQDNTDRRETVNFVGEADEYLKIFTRHGKDKLILGKLWHALPKSVDSNKVNQDILIQIKNYGRYHKNSNCKSILLIETPPIELIIHAESPVTNISLNLTPEKHRTSEKIFWSEYKPGRISVRHKIWSKS